MRSLAVLLGAVAIPRVYQVSEKMATFNTARKIADQSGKPLLNIGCGGPFHWFAQELARKSDVNTDIVPRDVPNFVLANVEDMYMFANKQFGAAFCSHVIEHVENPTAAMDELDRVADEVFIITPSWWDVLTYINPHHKWLMADHNFVRLR